MFLPFCIRIHILNADPDPAAQINADPDPQLWIKGKYGTVIADLLSAYMVGTQANGTCSVHKCLLITMSY